MNSRARGFQFLQGREGYCEEEEEDGKQMMLGDMGKRSLQSSPPRCPSPLYQYKGVVPQPKGRWGAQIYENHQHVWEGPFEREQTAKRAYDGALIKFPCRLKATTNFNSLELTDLSSSSGNSSDVVVEGDEGGSQEREHMFEKVVTPSDVGKLNRLVIPKQHAEKYFPLDWTVNEKGLLLNFEDRSGKSWRFRYSYWNSSQSYVMTKGWSRFVKEKKLDAGDIVSFQRGVGEFAKDRFYIDCKHRPKTRRLDSSSWPSHFPPPHPLSLHQSVPLARVFFPSTVSSPLPRPQMHLNCDDHRNYSGNGGYGYYGLDPGRPLFYAGSQHVGVREVPLPQGGNGSMASPMAVDSVPMIHYKAAGKRLRLFGVNLDCPTAGAVADNYDRSLLTPTTRTPRVTTIPSPSPSQPPLQLGLFNGAPVPVAPSQLSRKGKEPLSLGLDI